MLLIMIAGYLNWGHRSGWKYGLTWQFDLSAQHFISVHPHTNQDHQTFQGIE
jgi:hypothetical protein